MVSEMQVQDGGRQDPLSMGASPSAHTVRPDPYRKLEIANRKCIIAWEGWRIPARPAWHPVSVAGERRRGRMLIGDATQHVLLMQWWRPSRRDFDFSRWLRGRLKRVAGGLPPDPATVAPEGFQSAACLMDRTFGGGVVKTLWYGHAPADNLVLEITINDMAAEAARFAKQHVLPAVGVMPLSGHACWTVFDASFEAPPGFALRRKRLHSGDMVLEFAAGGRRTLLLRQVYPAAAALAKRTLERWIAAAPFAEQRRLAEAAQAPVAIGGQGGRAGLCRSGWKRHAVPLGRFRPLRTCAIAAVDAALDRILIAELTGGDDGGQDTVARAVARMNGNG